MNIISQLKISGRITNVVLLVLSLLFFTECKRTSKDEVSLGGNQKAATSDFYIKSNPSGVFVPYQTSTGAALSTPQGAPGSLTLFRNNTIYFKAGFSEVVSWNVTVKGLTSGATKIITGTSDSLNKSNTLWDGNASGIPFFMRNELAVATLTVLGSSISVSDTIKISSVKLYKGNTYNGVYYLGIDDFESPTSEGGFPLSAVSIDPLDANTVEYYTTSDKYVNGQNSFYMKGNDANWNGYIIAKTSSDLIKSFGIKETDPAKLYFNCYIYGTGVSNATISVELFEDEHPNDASTHHLGIDDGWIADIIVNWTGWKLVSVPYSTFKKAPNPLSSGNGNGVREPHLISRVSLTLNSYPTSGKIVDAYVDFATLTIGGPFVP